jgi:hypothetical protein
MHGRNVVGDKPSTRQLNSRYVILIERSFRNIGRDAIANHKKTYKINVEILWTKGFA